MTASRLPRAVLLAFALLLAAVAGVTAAPARPGSGLGEERVVALRGAASGTVVAIDPAARRLTVRGKLGEGTFRVDPKVGALDAIKVGDDVGLDYVAGIGLTVRRGGGEPRVTIDPPSGGAGQRITVVARVLAIDTARPSVRVQGPKGRVTEFPVQDKASLAGVRVGDMLTAVVYELVAVEVVLGKR